MQVEYHKVDYKDFGYKNSEVCNQILTLTAKYKFWFSGFCARIRDTDMTEYVLKKAAKHKHKFVLYNMRDTNTFYLVQYSKSFIKIYYCYDGKYKTIITNFNKAYKRGLELWEQQLQQENNFADTM